MIFQFAEICEARAENGPPTIWERERERDLNSENSAFCSKSSPPYVPRVLYQLFSGDALKFGRNQNCSLFCFLVTQCNLCPKRRCFFVTHWNINQNASLFSRDAMKYGRNASMFFRDTLNELKMKQNVSLQVLSKFSTSSPQVLSSFSTVSQQFLNSFSPSAPPLLGTKPVPKSPIFALGSPVVNFEP